MVPSVSWPTRFRIPDAPEEHLSSHNLVSATMRAEDNYQGEKAAGRFIMSADLGAVATLPTTEMQMATSCRWKIHVDALIRLRFI